MEKLDYLFREYPGDEAWSNYVNCFHEEWKNSIEKNKILSVVCDEDYAMVLNYVMGIDAIDWYKTPLSALDNSTPHEVVNLNPIGKIAIRTLLMRMPV